MGQQKHIVERAIVRMDVGLVGENIQSSRRQLAGPQGVDQSLVIDDGTAGRIHHDCPVGQGGQCSAIEQVVRFRRGGAMGLRN